MHAQQIGWTLKMWALPLLGVPFNFYNLCFARSHSILLLWLFCSRKLNRCLFFCTVSSHKGYAIEHYWLSWVMRSKVDHTYIFWQVYIVLTWVKKTLLSNQCICCSTASPKMYSTYLRVFMEGLIEGKHFLEICTHFPWDQPAYYLAIYYHSCST